MRGIKLISLLVILILFMPFCISMPISYDTAQIPNNDKTLRAGVGGQVAEGIYTISTGCSYDRIYYKNNKVRGDLQAGYGVKKFFEGGANVGIALGNHAEDSIPIRDELQADIYPYIKLGIPTDPVRFSLKYSAGAGFMAFRSYRTNEMGLIPIFGTYIDLLFGIGNPEFLTVGLRITAKETPFILVLSSHLFGFTLSFMYGYYTDNYDWSKNIYFGIGKTF